jgi:DNA-binding NarL/FixJ family response regulator
LEPTRILLVALPRMLEEIVSGILSSKRGLGVVGAFRKVDGLPRKLAKARPDVVVLGQDDPSLVAELLEQSPRLKVIAVVKEGQDAWLYSLSPDRTRLGALSPSSLVGAVQRADRPRPENAWWDR